MIPNARSVSTTHHHSPPLTTIHHLTGTGRCPLPFTVTYPYSPPLTNTHRRSQSFTATTRSPTLFPPLLTNRNHSPKLVTTLNHSQPCIKPPEQPLPLPALQTARLFAALVLRDPYPSRRGLWGGVPWRPLACHWTNVQLRDTGEALAWQTVCKRRKYGWRGDAAAAEGGLSAVRYAVPSENIRV